MSSYDTRLMINTANLESRLPDAPYPPAPSKSSLASSPHYATRPSAPVEAAVAVENKTLSATEVDRKLKFVSIRMAPSNPELFCAINLSDEDVQVRSKLGPVLCEIGKISFQPALRSQGRLWQTHQHIVSRGNPQLGPSISSTCLSWAPSSMQVATGLSTGNLCVHSFPKEGDKPETQEQFSIGRNKRPATAVAWRPNQTNHIALGLYLGGATQHHHQRKPRATDFGCLLWDITSNAAPLQKFCHNASVACLEWLPGGQTLAVGCHMRPLQLYDLRSTSSSPVSLRGADSTLGICIDQHILATYGAAFEPVKLWDLRNIDTPLAEIKVDQAPATAAWSRPGILSIAVENRILHYDTANKPVLIDQTYAPLNVLDMGMVQDQERFLVVLEDKSLHDVSKHTTAPLALSRRDGHIVHAFAHHVWRATAAVPEDDISNVMKSRAGCRQEARYAMDASTNMEILSGNPSLIQLWRWIDRMESIHTKMSTLSTSMNLMDGGVKNLVDMENSDVSEEVTVFQAQCLAMEIYDSPSRRAAFAACGWSSTEDTGHMLKECERQGEYERAAALAVWHDNVGAAVEILDKGAKKSDNASLLQLVSICIAGYNGANSTVWQKACSNLLDREELQQKSESVAYLHALLRFLLASQYQDGVRSVLDDDRLSLCDRVGFACRFLRRAELRSQLHKWVALCQTSGAVEGLVLTGLTLEGIKILQSFVDKTGDVQSAALVTSRVIMPSSWATERRICSEWLEVYRGLLNSWQMWQSRAMFDVDRAEMLRSNGQMAKHESRGSLTKNTSKEADLDFVLSPTIPAQLEARCNYCSVSLSGSRKQEGITNQWLSRSKNVLSCCPRCRKPLPRCAICLLSLGCLNPYMELKRAGSKNRGGANDLSSLANLPFAEWFTWCMRCKHGGHAHHLVGWFANHETCPVSGCDCQCQFDGIKLLMNQDPPPNNDRKILQTQTSLPP